MRRRFEISYGLPRLPSFPAGIGFTRLTRILHRNSLVIYGLCPMLFAWGELVSSTLRMYLA